MANIGRDIKEGEIVPVVVPDPTHVPQEEPAPIKEPAKEPEKV